VKLTDLRGILQYVPQFREKTFILAVDAGIVGDESFATLLLDVSLLRSLNIRVVLVHGAAEQILALAGASACRHPTSKARGSPMPARSFAHRGRRLTRSRGLSANDLRAACRSSPPALSG
jgi:amino-acid N-acetyltransferase